MLFITISLHSHVTSTNSYIIALVRIRTSIIHILHIILIRIQDLIDFHLIINILSLYPNNQLPIIKTVENHLRSAHGEALYNSTLISWKCEKNKYLINET